MVGVRAWFQRRDPNLLDMRRAVRVGVVACIGFYAGRYLAGNPVMASYALFAAVAMGFFAQIPGPALRRSATLLWSVPAACLLVTAGTLLASSVWAATVGMLALGFLVAYAGVGGPRLVGLTGGMHLFFVLACFPPYDPDTIISRLAGVSVGLALLAIAEQALWPDADADAAVGYEARLADAAEGLADHLAARATGDAQAQAATLAAAEPAAQAIRPSRLPLGARPASTARRDRALGDAASSLRLALARLREMRPGAPGDAVTAWLLGESSRTADAAAGALRGGPPPDTAELSDALAARRERDEATPDGTTALALATADEVWTMATAVRVALDEPIEPGVDRFGYAYTGSLRLWSQRIAVHLTPRSSYFWGAVRVAVALAAARLVAGLLDLSHGSWVLLATLTMLRGRAADIRIGLGAALAGTAAGAAAVAVLLLEVLPTEALPIDIGTRLDGYAAILPTGVVVALAAGAIIGQAVGQALLTVVITLVFAQLAPVGVALTGARVPDLVVGAAVGITAGVLAWPLGAGRDLRRSVAGLLAAGGDAVRETARVLTASRLPPSLTDPAAGAMPRVRQALALADASYGMYQTQRRRRADSTVDWQAVMVAGHNIVRGAERLRATYGPGSLAPWRTLVTDSAAKVDAACGVAADALYAGREPRVAPVAVGRATDVQAPDAAVPDVQAPDAAVPDVQAPDAAVLDVQVWLAGVADDLTRLGTAPLTPLTR